MSIELQTLPSGLRIITDRNKEVDSVAIGVWVDVGTRHEDLAENGIAHMVEHMMFAGTKTRTSKDIVEQIETKGGQMNAFTSREVTAYYIHLLKDDIDTALEILSDIIQNSQFPDKELKKERKVILQEIGMVNDTPDELVFDKYQETAYPGQSLGAPILGTAELIKNMKKESLQNYVKKFYTPSRLVISAAGNIEPYKLAKRAESLFSDLPPNNRETPYPPADYKGGETKIQKPLEQSHIVLGFQSIKKTAADYYPAILMSTIMGGGMSSRLYQEVREKKGFAYSVYSTHSAYHDDGQLEIYAGTSPEKLKELIPILCNEIKKMRQIPVEEKELSRAKSQLKASLLMGRESMLTRANRQARHLIGFGKKPNITEIIEKIENVTAKDIKTVAEKIFSGKPTLAALGDLQHLESYEKLENRLK